MRIENGLTTTSQENPSRLTLHLGRRRTWEEQERILVTDIERVRGLGIRISASSLFEMMAAQVPAFLSLHITKKWNWYRRFTKRHQLVIRRPNRVTGSARTDEQQRFDGFVASIRELMTQQQVSRLANYRYLHKTLSIWMRLAYSTACLCSELWRDVVQEQ